MAHDTVRQECQHLLETLELHPCICHIAAIGIRKVRECPRQADMRADLQTGENRADFLFRAHANAPHARVDFQVHQPHQAAVLCAGFERINHFRRADRQRQFVADALGNFFIRGCAQHQHRRGYARLTQRRAFIRAGNRQGTCARFQRGTGDLCNAVPISIRLDNGHQLRFFRRVERNRRTFSRSASKSIVRTGYCCMCSSPSLNTAKCSRFRRQTAFYYSIGTR